MSDSGYVRDEKSGKAAVAANLDEYSKYKAQKAARNKLKSFDARLTELEITVANINNILNDLIRTIKTNG